MAFSSGNSFIVTVLGSGTSQGVPMIGCPCAVCHSTDPRDSRTRSSLYITTPKISFLVDTSPELRQQAIREKIDRVDAVLFTHAHADHIMGLDDLRRFCDLNHGPLPVYTSVVTIDRLKKIFDYAFKPTLPGYVQLTPYLVDSTFQLGDLEITPLLLPHGAISTLGYLFKRGDRKLFAYLNDCQFVPQEIFPMVADCELLIIDGLRDEPHPTHLSIPEAIEVSRLIKPRQTFLTHLTHQKTHVEREAELPTGVLLAYDGQKIVL